MLLENFITMNFDRMGRRTFYKEEVNGVVTKHHRFVYDNYLCVQKVDALNNNAQINLFVWDPTEPIATRPLFTQRGTGYKFFYTCDGNKNVSELVHFETRNGIAAHYDYAPFGAVTRAISASVITDNTFTTDNPFRFPSPGGLGRIFSSEYHDDTLGLVYYNYRHYNPIDGRWCSRDPIEEESCINLFSICKNRLIVSYDWNGLWSSTWESYGDVRRVYQKENGDTIEGLAALVGLDYDTFRFWARKEEQKKPSSKNTLSDLTDNLEVGCYVSIPNVWIEADLLRGGGLWDYCVVNWGGTIGSFFGQTLGRWGCHTLTPSTPTELLTAVLGNVHNLYGMTVYAHGSPDGYIVNPKGDRMIHQMTLINAIGESGFKIAIANMMQCYSVKPDVKNGYRSINFQDEWEKSQ